MSPATLSLSLALGAAFLLPQAAQAAFIDLTTTGPTGSALDNGTRLTELPLTVAVGEIPGLSLTVASGSSFNPGSATVNGDNASFGVNSPTPDGGSENPSGFDVDAAESLTLTFDQDVVVESIELTSFTGSDGFSAGGVSFFDDDASARNVFTFGAGGLPLPTGNGFTLQAVGPAGTSVGVERISVVVIPEPGSLALLGLVGVMAARRRRG